MARLALLLAVLLLVAGCAGKANPRAGPSTSDPDILPPGVDNVLEGTVRGVDMLPIPDVNMTVAGLSDFQATDEKGYYRFENLPPRDYVVTASKQGFHNKSHRAIMEDGLILVLNFTLEERPLTQPYNVTRDQEGYINCQFSFQSAPDNRQATACGENLPNNRQVHDFTIDAGAAQLQVELFWTKKSEAARNLQMIVESLGDNAVTYADETGPTGLKVLVSQSLLSKTIPEGGKVRVFVKAAPGALGDEDGTDAGLAFQQDYVIYVTAFYVEPGPNDFSALRS